MDKNFKEMKEAEAEYFNKSAHCRTVFGQIPMEADMRRAMIFIPAFSEQEPIDLRIIRILSCNITW